MFICLFHTLVFLPYQTPTTVVTLSMDRSLSVIDVGATAVPINGEGGNRSTNEKTLHNTMVVS